MPVSSCKLLGEKSARVGVVPIGWITLQIEIMHGVAVALTTVLLAGLLVTPPVFASNCDALADVCVCLSEENAQCIDTNFDDLTFLRALRNRSRFSEISVYHNSIPVLKDLVFHGLQLTHLRTIRLVHNGITAVEQRAFHGLRKLKKVFLMRNNIKTLHPDTFHNSTKLQILDLSNNQIVHINAWRNVSNLENCRASNNTMSLPDEAFTSSRTSRLKTLVLANNKIVDIDSQAFGGLTNLETLTLPDNRITSLHPHTFLNTTKLRQLDLRRNVITRLDFVRGVPSLTYLTVSNNRLVTLEDDTFFSDPPSSLTYINLADNKITSIEHRAFQGLHNVRNMVLSGNAISHIHAETFHNTTNLSFLDLKNNRISQLQFVRNIIMLLNIDLSCNEIETLPAEAFFHPNITQLINNITVHGHTPIKLILTRTITHVNLSNNRITSIEPKALEGLLQLCQLDLTGNNISFLYQDIFQYNTQLTELYLKNNRISDIRVLSAIPSLEICDLSDNTISVSSINTVGINTISHLHLVDNNITFLHPNTFQNFTSLTLLNLMNNKIQKLNFLAGLPILEKLQLSNNTISGLTNNTFPVKLTFIDLSHNNIREIDRDVFEGMYNLSILNMSGNRITSLHSDMFRHAASLNELNLEHNQLTNMNFLRTISSLRKLNMCNNFISVIPNVTFMNSNILSISLDDNVITDVQKGAFRNLKQLQHLSVVGNNITHIPNDTFINNTGLKKLKLSGNKLTLLGFLRNVSNLETFDMSGNNISSLLNGLFVDNNICRFTRANFANNRISTIGHLVFHNIVRLQEIDLSSNVLSSLHAETFQACPSLLKLDLSSNRISEIEVIRNVPRLKHLYLFNNTISALGNSTFSNSQLNKLVHLNLRRNRLSTIDGGAFRSLRLLKYLDLSMNNLTFLPRNVFQNNTLLVSLDVSLNRIACLDITLRSAQNLEFYNVSHNAVSFVPSNAFTSKLRYLDISNNNITVLAPCAFQGLPQLRFLDLSGNTASPAEGNECSVGEEQPPRHSEETPINMFEVSNSELEKYANLHLWFFHSNSTIR